MELSWVRQADRNRTVQVLAYFTNMQTTRKQEATTGGHSFLFGREIQSTSLDVVNFLFFFLESLSEPTFQTYLSFSFFATPFSSMAQKQSKYNGRISWSAGHPGRQLRDALRHLPHVDICTETMLSLAEDSRQQAATHGAESPPEGA